MKTSTQILPGIKNIYWLDRRHLPRRVDLSAICGMPIPIFAEIHKIDFFDSPLCKCTTIKEGAGLKDSASLEFKSDRRISVNDNLAFIVTDVSDNSFLLGAREGSPLDIEIVETSGTPGSDPAGFSYKITHNALRSMMQCLV